MQKIVYYLDYKLFLKYKNNVQNKVQNWHSHQIAVVTVELLAK